jgi:hypothetical protein
MDQQADRDGRTDAYNQKGNNYCLEDPHVKSAPRRVDPDADRACVQSQIVCINILARETGAEPDTSTF